MRVQSQADAAEALFHKVRFAAGISTSAPAAAEGTPAAAEPGGEGAGMQQAAGSQVSVAASAQVSVTEGAPASAATAAAAGASVSEEADTTYQQPDPEPIIARFTALEDELSHVDATLADYAQRLAVLTSERAHLAQLSEPRARDSADETDLDLHTLDGLRARVDAARRQKEAVHREAEEVAVLRLQLEQSVSVLAERLAVLTSLPDLARESLPPQLAAADGTVTALLKRSYFTLPSAWCARVHERLTSVVTRLQELMRRTDLPGASEAFVHAATWMASNMGLLGGGGGADKTPAVQPGATPALSTPSLSSQQLSRSSPVTVLSSSGGGGAGGSSGSGDTPASGGDIGTPGGDVSSAANNPAPRKLIPSLGHRQASARLILQKQGSMTDLSGGAQGSPILMMTSAAGKALMPAAATPAATTTATAGAPNQQQSQQPVPGSTILGELPESPLFTRKAPLDEATREMDARFDATIEALVSRNAHVVRIRPGSGAGATPATVSRDRRPVNSKPVSRKAISEAVNAFERSWREGPAPEEAQEAARAFATLQAKSECPARTTTTIGVTLLRLRCVHECALPSVVMG